MSPDNQTAPTKNEQIPIELWQRLYGTAAKVREMEPWRWMEETDIFGVKVQDNDVILFVSVMGLLGEYHAVALYPGEKAVSQFWEMQRMSAERNVADLLVGIRQVHAAFGPKRELESEEKRIVRQLGLNFKGANAWPYFRAYRPGWFPWLVDLQEAQWALLALEQLLDVAPRLKGDRRLVARKPGTSTYFVRVADGGGEIRAWHDEKIECPPPSTPIELSVPMSLLGAVRGIERSDLTIELDVAPSPMPIGTKGERPQMPYLMLAVEPDSSFVLGAQLLMVDGEMESMWAQVPAKLLEMIASHKMRPGRIVVRTPWVAAVLGRMCQELGIVIEKDTELPAVEEVRKEIEGLAMGR